MQAATCRPQSENDNQTSQKWLAEARRTGVTDNYTGKRREPRSSWNAQVTVDVLEDEETVESYYANSLDISAGGMGLRCRKPIPTHALVRITVDETGEAVLARVAQCTQGVCDYHVGVEFVKSRQAGSTPKSTTNLLHAGLRPTARDGRCVQLPQTQAA